MIDLAILIVAYRSAADLPRLLAGVHSAAGDLDWRAVVVDNYGEDQLTTDDPLVEIVRSGTNLGYSGGLNLALDCAPASRFTAFLNPDLELDPGSLAALTQACTPAGVGAAVPLVLDADGAAQPSLRREPSTLRSLGEAVFGDHWPTRPAYLAEMLRDPESYRSAGPVDWATGAALVVRSEILAAVGDWDAARFFLYSEETDYARRIRGCGYRIEFVPHSVVRHRGAGSGSSAELDALLAVNKVRYYRKWHGRVPSAAFFAVAVAHNLLRLRRPSSRLALRALFSAPTRAMLPGGAP
ncbi:glycosyltransferase family 2 protein [Cryobacterium soli]|jgi:N-acetylglucosaminyl-diphospho-decaprenol L-rhamnosyltransferase|uniref:glycosyltransferase family 2 protein n=1 Tax=Cryobacterium soli TaxID=2220095 RepID=UPI000E734461|nr:glycosyltransferase family 2 protein [Cryobacterium soli]